MAALDRNGSVGTIDSHFPGAAFFTEFERFALRSGADAICGHTGAGCVLTGRTAHKAA